MGGAVDEKTAVEQKAAVEQKTAVLKMTARPKVAREPAAPVASADAGADGSATKVNPVTSAPSIVSPIEALERDEILRTRAFCMLVWLLAVVGVSTTFVIPGGDPRGQRIMFLACGLAAAAMGFLMYQTLDPLRFRQRRTTLVWFFPAIAVNAAIYYFGVFSPAPMLVVLGLYFVGLGKSQALAWVAYAMCVVLHVLMVMAPLLGYRDIGVMHPDLSTEQELIVAVLMQFIMLITMVIARLSRKTALVAVGELEQAVRLAAHRQALLLEARDELERALRSKRGRFSDQLIGTYLLGDVIGRGAMGEVYAAVDNRNGKRCAIKLLSQMSLGHANHVLRFLRELRTAASIESPHVVRVIEIGEQPVPYLVMEQLDGKTLSDILRERRTLPPVEVSELVEQVGVGITAAAAAGVVHRDLKPQNLFLHGGVWKVLDFGVARAMDQGDTLTAGQIVGTPSYMSPEQASGQTVDHRTDLYALAAVAYRALTGHPPFASQDVAETVYRVVHTRPIRPTLLAPELPADVDLVLAIGMARDANDRFASARELATALRAAVAEELPSTLRARGAAIIEAAGWSTVIAPLPRK